VRARDLSPFAKRGVGSFKEGLPLPGHQKSRAQALLEKGALRSHRTGIHRGRCTECVSGSSQDASAASSNARSRARCEGKDLVRRPWRGAELPRGVERAGASCRSGAPSRGDLCKAVSAACMSPAPSGAADSGCSARRGSLGEGCPQRKQHAQRHNEPAADSSGSSWRTQFTNHRQGIKTPSS